jgi:predicted DNA-binding transcriptional regulator
VTSLSIPFPITEALGLATTKGAPPKMVSRDSRVSVEEQSGEILTTPTRGTFELLPQELERIQLATVHIAPALSCLERQQDGINDQRLLKQALGKYSVLGLWNRALSWIGWAMRTPTYSPAERINQVERSISESIGELKRITEHVVVPALSEVREEFRGRTFVRDDKTPKALLMVSVPSEKLDKFLSFDALKITIDARRSDPNFVRELPRGDGRIVLERSVNGAKQQIELSYKRPGKVDVYVNGERRGSMWNDDALDLAEAFIAGRSIPLVKRGRSREYTVG